ncbi:MAG: ComEC/Rec2 family competence protein [Bacteroidaceae bacterium]|nr:ComEC/Rec2 family competence protein [Bacteroidaceae bacterium]
MLHLTYNNPFGRIVEESPLTLLLLPLMVGIAVAELAELPFKTIPYIIAAAGVSMLAAVVVGWPKLRKGREVKTRLFLFFVAVLMVMIGMFSDIMRYEHNRTEWPSERREWRGVVNDVAQTTAKTWRVSVVVSDGSLHRKVMLSILQGAMPAPPKVGEALSFYGTIEQPHNFEPKGRDKQSSSFDYARWLRRQGYSGQAFVPSDVRVLTADEAQAMRARLPLWQRLRVRALTLRSKLLRQYSRLNLATDDAAVLAALTLGDKSAVTKDTRENYSLSGASHVLALSGLHLSILASLVFLLLSPLRMRRLGQWISAIVMLALVWGFVFLTGCSISIVRSALMLSFVLILGFRGEGMSSVNNVVMAAFVVLLLSPQSLMDVGFQLSFLAVFFLIYFLPYFKESLMRRAPRWSRGLLGFLYVTIVAQLATAPVVACVFGRVPLLFLVTNLLVIPCAYVLLIGAVCYFVLSWWPAVAVAIGWVLARTVELMNGGLAHIASLPGASVEVHLSPLATLFIYPLMFTVFAWLYFRRRIYGWYTLLFAGCVISCQLWAA